MLLRRCVSALLAVLAIGCDKVGSSRERPPAPRAPAAITQDAAAASVTAPSQPPANPCDAPLYSAPANAELADLAQTSRMLVWRERRGVIAFDKPAGPARVLLALDAPRELAVDEQYAYVALQSGALNGLYRLPLAGGAPERMAVAGGVFNTIDDVLVTESHVIMSRNMGELVRIAKTPPFAAQAFARRDQRRNNFGQWAVSEHAAWFDRPGRGIGSGGWVRLDFATGSVATIAGPVVTVVASGASALLVRGSSSLRPADRPQPRAQQLFAIDEGTGAVSASPWWTGFAMFGFAIDRARVAFSTTLEAPDNQMPTTGWMSGAVGQSPPTRFRACPAGTSLMNTALGALFDGDSVYALVSDNNNAKRIVRITRQE